VRRRLRDPCRREVVDEAANDDGAAAILDGQLDLGLAVEGRSIGPGAASGEISGGGQAVLDRLGVLPRCHEAGAVYARTALFVCGARRSPVRRLAAPALCLSRHTLDALLAELFQQGGGELRVNDRQPPAGERAGWVYASGRRIAVAEKSPRWFGVKAHVPARCTVPLEADLEMHVSPQGYIGVNRIGAGEVNVCGLLQVRAESGRPESKEDWLRGGKGSLLGDRLRSAVFDPDSFCSVAGLQLQPRRAAARAECCIGDALTMTPPATGNGMSMAFESAELAIEPCAAYSGGKLDWPDARCQVARRCDLAFARRLAWARLLQGIMISPVLHCPFGAVLLRSEWLWRLMFTRTR